MKTTKREAKKLLAIEADAELARFFGINNRQAVSQWPDDKPIPALRQYQLRELRPDLFGPPTTDKQAA